MFGETMKTILRTLSSSLEYPVIIFLLLLMAVTLLLLGSLIAEIFTEHRHLKVKLPALERRIRKLEEPLEEVIETSGLLKRQKKILLSLLQPGLTNEMRESLALRELEEEQARFNQIVKISDLICKLGPMFGLMGTLIPLGPGIIALGQGDTYTLSQSLMTAFDTTIAGLASAAVAMIISTVRKGWYKNYMIILEEVMEYVLEVQKDAA